MIILFILRCSLIVSSWKTAPEVINNDYFADSAFQKAHFKSVSPTTQSFYTMNERRSELYYKINLCYDKILFMIHFQHASAETPIFGLSINQSNSGWLKMVLIKWLKNGVLVIQDVFIEDQMRTFSSSYLQFQQLQRHFWLFGDQQS